MPLPNNIKLFKLLSQRFADNITKSEMMGRLGPSPYGYGNNRNTCKTNLMVEARQIRKLLLDIIQELNGRD